MENKNIEFKDYTAGEYTIKNVPHVYDEVFGYVVDKNILYYVLQLITKMKVNHVFTSEYKETE